jgi:hypothetical protein
MDVPGFSRGGRLKPALYVEKLFEVDFLQNFGGPSSHQLIDDR